MSSVRHVVTTAVTKVGLSAFAAVSAILIAHGMGTTAVGLFGLTRAVPAIGIMVTELGLSRSSPYLVNKRRIESQRVLSMLMFGGIAIGLFDFVVWIALTPIIRDHVLKGMSTSAVMLLGLTFPLAILQGNLMNLFRALQRYHAANVVRLLVDAVSFVAIAAAVLFSAPVGLSLVGSVLLGYGSAVFVGCVALVKIGLKPRPSLDRRLFMEGVHFGVRGQLGNALNFLNYRLDHVILAAFVKMDVVGVYVIATKAAELFKVVPGAVGFVLESSLAEMGPRDAIAKVRRMMLPVFLGNLAVVAIAFVLGPYLIPLFFGSSGADAIVPYQILLLGMMALGDNALMSSLNLGQGRPELNTYAVVVSFIVTLALDIVLIPAYGIRGAAIASTCSYTACGLVLLFFLSRPSLFERAARTSSEAVADV
jgi:O-antigen/teichoic acid export membrane protein